MEDNRDKDIELKFAALEATFQSWQKMSDEGKVAVLDATFKVWKDAHITEHVLEQRAVELAYKALEGKMVELNDIRHRFVDKEWYEANHGKTEVRIAGLEQSRVEKDWFDKVHGALEAKVAVLDEWRWKTIGMVLASCFLASGVGGLIGWAITVYYMHK